MKGPAPRGGRVHESGRTRTPFSGEGGMAGRKTGTLGEAFVGIAAVIASFLTMYAVGVRLHTGPTAAIMSAVLALTLARRPRTAHASPWLTAATLPLVA